jgi:hypothetical protein
LITLFWGDEMATYNLQYSRSAASWDDVNQDTKDCHDAVATALTERLGGPSWSGKSEARYWDCDGQTIRLAWHSGTGETPAVDILLGLGVCIDDGTAQGEWDRSIPLKGIVEVDPASLADLAIAHAASLAEC